ncbi:MAG: crossover junction endodeoxyribonuclease RuvC [Clostridiales Family XIII bacterium]|jgi:crossover junction endodeoxyribonuclease RuvC|nr:crossover junction endodeoxyribonuclease RuvC [Clostridiales Family XIII bacterium]
MRILGVDPGYALLGYGIVDSIANKYTLVECGVVATDKDMAMPDRLNLIFGKLTELIAEFRPEVAAVEELFWGTNQKTAIHVSEARGAAVVACARAGLHVYEYTPLQIKQALTGNGRAEKQQMQEVVRNILGLKEIIRPDDAADAAAAAICHGNSAAYIDRVGRAVARGR